MRGVGCAVAHREAVRLSVLGLLCPRVTSQGLRCLPELPSRQRSALRPSGLGAAGLSP